MSKKYVYPGFKGLAIAVSDSAMRELVKESKTIYDVIEILEFGYDAPRKRKSGVMEKWLDRGKKTFNAVIAKDHHEILKEDCWVLIHFGKFTKRR
ncbi:MAG: hypothetical protein HY544_00390 [Candidatus Diapherotrites archaeon]|uniref:Uncharacterized protein n=1 Tax=Candidatus Iainarchaeum sp. TaxID=3101447 RepID=A0A8T3YJV1_9ARCH|nr:hypothetical protein [Candidatus Diapherotrites archaeon]